jgi:hypothetical protein
VFAVYYVAILANLLTLETACEQPMEPVQQEEPQELEPTQHENETDKQGAAATDAEGQVDPKGCVIN